MKLLDFLVGDGCTASTIPIVQMLMSAPETWIIAIPDIDAATNGGTTNASNKSILAKKAVIASTQQAVTIAIRELLFPSVSLS
jgi:hypothetical protein